ncbi:hypothetical protein DFR49_3885 [Hephaestia caeni]|uniref:AtuA-like ferredoxin-fold domain-containing protein n=2 Tax=Hephaestia caeni TaxID=645617 RepID=A0A397NGF0_9SPHN|nr:hypothetical protein DFR49_3885 [Hephaestia caeni]
MLLRDLAHVRTGDKGDISQISVILYDIENYALLADRLSVEVIRRHLCALPIFSGERYELPELGALNFVLRGALSGGVTRSLALDAHGKTLGAQLLDIEIISIS